MILLIIYRIAYKCYKKLVIWGKSGKAIEREDGRADGARIRLDWLDALKGIGIIAVVAAHVWTRGPVRDAIYAVHMLLLHALGYTARGALAVPLPAMVRGLLVPFLCFVLLLAADFLIEAARGAADLPRLAGRRADHSAGERPDARLVHHPVVHPGAAAGAARLERDRRRRAPSVRRADAAHHGGGAGLALLQARGGMRSPFGAVAVPGALLMIWAGALWRQWGDPSRTIALALAGLAVCRLPPPFRRST